MTTPTIDPHTATLEQCCDYIAECLGFERIYHPTLDSIAASLPEGWRWDYVRERSHSIPWYAAARMRTDTLEGVTNTVASEADTELLARVRTSVMAWRKTKRIK